MEPYLIETFIPFRILNLWIGGVFLKPPVLVLEASDISCRLCCVLKCQHHVTVHFSSYDLSHDILHHFVTSVSCPNEFN